MFVIVCKEAPRAGLFVSRRGMEHSYTPDLKMARKFATFEDAKHNACGNEEVKDLERVLDQYRR